MIKYSIIIPHKNIPECLERCLKSIPEDPSIQVVVVDDNSDADKIDKIKKLCNRTNVELVLTKEGKGAGYARNKGLERAKGKWLLFSDADDYFEEGLLQKIEKYYDSGYDLIIFKFKTVDSETLEELPSRVFGFEKAMRRKDYDYLRFGFGVPWSKMIRKSVVDEHNIRYEETRTSNDVWFAGHVGYYAREVVTDENIIYISALRKGSLVNVENISSLEVRIGVGIRYNEFMDSIHKNKYGCRVNYLTFIWYMKSVDYKAFKHHLKVYFNRETLPHIIGDFWRCFLGVVRHVMNPKSNNRKNVKLVK